MELPTLLPAPIPRKLARALAVLFLTLFVLPATAGAQTPVFELAGAVSLVVATGQSEVLGPVLLTAAASCGTAADGRCVSTAGVIHILYAGLPLDNGVGTGITVTETVGGVTTTAPAAGTLLSGAVTVSNTPAGGQVSVTVNGGVDLAAGDEIRISGVRGQIILSPAGVPGIFLNAQLSASGDVGTFTQTSLDVARSAVGLEFILVETGPVVALREGFPSAFVQHVASGTTGPPANPRPAFGATNNTQVRIVVSQLPGRILWPQMVPSQLGGAGGVASGGSEMRLVSQDTFGTQATYEFLAADQSLSDTAQETFLINPAVCGFTQFSLQVQLGPEGPGRPRFMDSLIPSPPAEFANRTTCDPSPLVIVSGDGQIGNTGTELDNPLVVRAQDENGNPVAGARVNFAAGSSGNGSVTSATAVTDAQGLAQTGAVLGPEAGPHNFTASVNAFTVTFFANALPTQVPPLPVTTVVPHLPAGGGFLTRMAVLNLDDEANEVQINLLGQNGQLRSRQRATLAASGRLDLPGEEAERFAAPTIQWAIVGSQKPIGVEAFFDVKLSAAAPPLTAESFSASETVRRLTVPFSQAPASGGQSLSEGLALTNFSSTDNALNLQLVDAVGTVRAQDRLVLAPFGQTAFILTDLPAFQAVLGNDPLFSGSLVVDAAEALAAVGVGGEEGRLFAIPRVRTQSCWLSPFSPTKVQWIPHIPVGGGWTTRIIVTNLCAVPNPIRFETFDQAGNAVPSFLAPQATLQPGASAVFFPSAEQRVGALTVQWARLSSDLAAAVHVLHELAPSSPEATGGLLGTTPSAASTRLTLPMEFGSGRTVGLALANTTDVENTVVLQLVDAQGMVQAEDASIHLPARGQTAVVVSALPALSQFLTAQPEFNGTLVVLASQPVAALGVGSSGPLYPISVLTNP